MAQQQLDDLPQDLRAWGEQHLGTAEGTVTQQSGGANNKVYLWQTKRDRVIVKLYGPIISSQPDRHQAETEFLSYANEVASEFVPNLLHSDLDHRIVAMEYLEGTGFQASYEPTEKDVQRAADFLSALNANKTDARGKIKTQATDGFLSLSEHANDVENRLATLGSDHLPVGYQGQAMALITAANSRWQVISENLRNSLSTAEVSDSIEQATCALSPSDFGFHNAISCTDGLKFHDFEFAGWDDPTKAVVDFFLQPRVSVSTKYLNIIENVVASTMPMDILRPRTRALSAILHLKWVTIVLAVLRPQRLDAMLAADISQTADTLIKERLARAEILLSEGVPIGLP
ncbi:MAG: phosphotransferase [Rhodospirillaceae bacterium]|nr:phosphotransferase [Rhodospirillaceae bacterium]MBT5564259.1 phosphotransferase [Rhodospirillaceae bacterium]MBT6088824.1 phosphotransferase [Rhodospirillaceae bacterium]MBT7449345.1 phosphotransferase [Rhodospirillaceae bacterium]